MKKHPPRQPFSIKTSRTTEVMLALALDTEAPDGEKPTLEEIALWHYKKLPQKRAMQVKAYVSRDADCYAQWAELIACENELAEEQNTFHIEAKISRPWRHFLSEWRMAAGTAVFVSITLVMVIFGLQKEFPSAIIKGIEQDYHYFDTYPEAQRWYSFVLSTKTYSPFSQATPFDQAKSSIAVGVNQGLKQLIAQNTLRDSAGWQAIAEDYSPQGSDCNDQLDCPAEHELLVNFGRWLVLMNLNCIQRLDNQAPDYWLQQQTRMDYFAAQAKHYADLAPLIDKLQQWRIPPKAPGTAFCHDVGKLMAMLE